MTDAHFAESKYWLLYSKNQTLMQQLAINVSCDGELKQCSVNASKDMFGYMDVLHSRMGKSEIPSRSLFIVFLQRLFSGYRPYSIRRSLQFLGLSTTPGTRH